MILKGMKVNGGKVEGEAVVSKKSFSFLGDFNPRTGRVQAPGSDVLGESLAGKIFIFTIGKGSTVGPTVAYGARRLGLAPAALVCVEAEPVMAMVAIMNDIPMVHALERDPTDLIKTGDIVRVDGDAATVEIVGQ
jgi:predicted aconitase with swiveling domain